MHYTFSIIITTHNRVTTLKNLLHDLEKQTYKRFSTVVIDDASTDATKNLTNTKTYEKTTLFHSKDNLKMVKARNKGIKLTNKKADYILIMDDDNRIDRDFLEKINTFVQLYPHFGIVGFKIYYHNRKTILSCGCDYNLSIMFPQFIKEDFYSDYIPTDVVANAFLVKKKLLQKLKHFDERYVIDFSETEFCFRAKNENFKVVTANIPIYHQSDERDFFGELMRRAESRPETYFYTYRNKYVIVSSFGTIVNKILFFSFFQFVTLFGYFYMLLQRSHLQYFMLYLKGFFAGNYYLLTGKLLPYEKN